MCAAALVWRSTEVQLKTELDQPMAAGVFYFKNAGDHAVRILSLTPSCDCLQPALKQNVYAPGEAGEIRVEFSLGGRAGRQEKNIAVLTSDDAPNAPTVLKMIVDIPEPVVLQPRFLFWRLGEDPAAKDIEIIIAEPAKTTLGDAQCATAGFSVQLESAGSAGHHRLRIKPIDTKQLLQATIRLNATVNGQPRVFVLYAAVK